MTVLTKPIVRELPILLDRSQYIVELKPWGVEFRRKRSRTKYPVTWDQIFNRAMQIEVARVRLEKAERRKAKKAGK